MTASRHAPTPWALRGARLRRGLDYLKEWPAIALGGAPSGKEPILSFGHKHVPGRGEPAHGGMIKMQHLAARWPHDPYRYNILYLGSSSLPRDWRMQARLARLKGARVVLNQNGVASPSWARGDHLEAVNEPMRALLQQADYVFYQSAFCKRGADHFLAPRNDRCEVLINPIDTDFFTPAEQAPPRRPLVLLCMGTINEFYRFEAAVRALAILRRTVADVRLRFAGSFGWSPDAGEIERQVDDLLRETGTAAHVERPHRFTQLEAPGIYRACHILLHAQFNDNCPTVVEEAMACGLPVVYSATGGTPELVGPNAGLGVTPCENWDERVAPDAAALAEAIEHVNRDWATYSAAARRRALERFGVERWLARHHEIFEQLLRKGSEL